MVKSPLLSVVMPVYNQGNFLRHSLNSLMRQTFDDYELILIDDGSSDETEQILKEYDSDVRLKVHRFVQNQGIVACLNYGIAIARGEYIARMDGDDVALPERFATQIIFLQEHSFLAACGSFVDTIDVTGQVLGRGWVHFVHPGQIKFMLLFGCPICHPSVMLRKSVLQQHDLKYDPRYPHGQDYDLWYRLSKVGLLANVPQVLLQYRMHPQQVSSVGVDHQKRTSMAVLHAQLHDLGIAPTHDELETHLQMSHFHFKEKKPLDPTRFIQWITKIRNANSHLKVYDESLVAMNAESLITYYTTQYAQKL
jgi:glycosyltransferase involved in cell wall biosynthesis